MNRPLLFLIAFLSMAGCGPRPIAGLYINEDFTAQQLMRGEMMVGGIAHEPGKFNLQQSENFAPSMVSALVREHRYLNAHPPGELRTALGDGRYLDVMNQFAKADLSRDTLATIATLLPNVRYLALARIDANAYGGINTSKEEKKTTNGVRHYVLHVRSLRKMIVTMAIYDLKSSSIAFSGRVDDEISSEEERTFEGSESVNIGGFILGHLSGDIHDPDIHAPPMPSTEIALERVIRGFSSNLPLLRCWDAPKGRSGGCVWHSWGN